MAFDNLREAVAHFHKLDDEINLNTESGKKAIGKQHEKGKLHARERIEMFLDPGTFLEIDAFVEHRCYNFGMEEKRKAGDGVVTGYGLVDGRQVFVYVDDFTYLGGALGEMHSKKICKVLDLARETGCPIVGIHDSGGGRIQEGVDAKHGYGEIFYRNSIMSGVVPQISIIVGPCAGGAVYSPALTDFIFMVDHLSHMYVTGPRVIKVALGEDVTPEQLGGARVQNSVSGVAHFMNQSEQECYQSVRRLLGYLPSNNKEVSLSIPTADSQTRTQEDFLDYVPTTGKKSYDMKYIINGIVDAGSFMETQELFAKNIITGFSRINGESVGIIASQPNYLAGCIDINASVKASRFIRFCDCFNIPILTLVDVPGFLPGSNQEFGGIIRHGAKMLYAYSEATVPKVTLLLRKAYGGAHNAMCSKELRSDFYLSWPVGEIAVMGAAEASNIIFKKELDAAEDPEALRREKIEEYERDFSNPYAAARRGYVDRIIDPVDSRFEIIRAFDALKSKNQSLPWKKHSNIPL
jgi:acetyl-CoA carboxylase carboxyltransferase component